MPAFWTQAKSLAEKTPAERNRYVDFLRAVSILMVVTGHWLGAAPWVNDCVFVAGDILQIQPDTQWLYWIFQVMPIFFIVGGYANAVSLESANRRGVGYSGWLASRLYRLVTPLLGLLVGWGLLALTLYFFSVDGDVTRLVTRAALIPTWFLAIYIAIVMLAPLTYKAWQRWGFASLLALVAAGALVDALFFSADMKWLGWTQYFWVWLSVHHLGYAWRDDRLGPPWRMLAWSALGFAALWLLIFKGPYPFAMVGSPDAELSNTLPPKMTLFALGLCQFGLFMSIERPMRKVLSSVRLWAATVLINSMIMTLYLWHVTVMIVVVAITYMAGADVLNLEPGTQTWWLLRPGKIVLLYAILLPLTFALSALERRPRPADAPTPSTPRQILGAIMICLGIAYLALFGFGSAPLPYLDIAAFMTVVAGSWLSGLLHGFR